MNNIELAREHLHGFLEEQVRHALTSALGVYCITEAFFNGAKSRNIPKEFSDTLLKGRRGFVDLLTTEQCIKMYHTGVVPDEYRPHFLDGKIWEFIKMDAEHRLKLYKGVTDHLATEMLKKLVG